MTITAKDWKTREAQQRVGSGQHDGLYAEVDQYGIQVWTTVTGYGRIHHLTGSLVSAEKALQALQNVVVNARPDLLDQGISFRDMGEIYVDSRNTPSKEKLVVNWYARAQGQWTDEQQDAVAELMPRQVQWNKSYPQT